MRVFALLALVATLVVTPGLHAAPGLSTIAVCDPGVPAAGACRWATHEDVVPDAWDYSRGPFMIGDGQLAAFTVTSGAGAGAVARRVADGAEAWSAAALLRYGDVYHVAASGGSAPALLIGGYAWADRGHWLRDSYVASLDPMTGQLRWADQLATPAGGNATTYSIGLSGDGALAFASTGGYASPGGLFSSLRAFRVDDGSIAWEIPGAEVAYSLLADDTSGALLAVSWDGHVTSYDAATGARRWRSADFGWPDANFVFRDPWDRAFAAIDAEHEAIVVATTVRLYGALGNPFGTDAFLVALRIETGEPAWSQRVDLGASDERLESLAVGAGRVFVGISTDQGDVFARNSLLASFDGAAGAPVWSVPVPAPLTSLVASPDGSHLYAGGKTENYYAGTPWSHNVYLGAFDAATARPTWAHVYEREIASYSVLRGIALTPDGQTVLARIGNGPTELGSASVPPTDEYAGATVTMALRAR